jgi:PAS domain S-box-containing protein
VSAEQQALVLNAIPLIVVGGAYLVAGLSLGPSLLGERERGRKVDYALAVGYPCGGLAAVTLGVLVLLDGRPLAGNGWIALAAILLGGLPALLFFRRWRDRALLLTGAQRTQEAEQRTFASKRRLEDVASISNRLARTKDVESAARLLLDEVSALAGAEMAGLVLLDEESQFADGVLAREAGRDVDWFPDVRIDLRNEPSGVASAVFDASSFAVYDATQSPRVSRRLVERADAKSTAYVPLIADARVIGCLVLASITEHRAFDQPDLALLESIAAQGAMAIDRRRVTAALGSVLEQNELRARQQDAVLRAARTLTGELEVPALLDTLVRELVTVLNGDAADCWLLAESGDVLRCRAVYGLPESELGREVAPPPSVLSAIAERGPAVRRDLTAPDVPQWTPAYPAFEEALAAQIVVQEQVRGVVDVYSLESGRFQKNDLTAVEALTALASLALRGGEAFDARSRQARIERGFYRIAAVLSRSLSLPATYDAVAQAANEALGGGFAAALAPRAGTLALAGSHRLPPALRAELEGSPPIPPALLAAVRDRRMLASPNLALDDRFEDRWQALGAETGFASLLVIPVEVPVEQDAAVVVVVCFEEARSFSNEDLELARHVAGAARGALERANLFETERGSRTLAQQLARTGSALATELDPAAVLDEVVEQAPALLGADACAIRVLEGEELVVAALSEPALRGVLGHRAEAGAWLSGEVVQSHGPVALADAAADERLGTVDPLLRLGYTAYLGVPLEGPEGVLHGVLSVYDKQPRAWRPEEVEALLALAANASAALSNAELYQRVALEKERSAAILDNVADGIVAVDRDGHVVLWNSAAEEITGVSAAEALGRDPDEVLGRQLGAGDDAPAGESFVAVRRGGEDVWLSVAEATMRDPAGAVAGRIFAFRDISADRQVEQMKSDFVSTVSHELRTPLTSIYGFAETLLRQDVLFGDDEKRTFLRYIAAESQRLTRIVDALLSVARLDTGDLDVSIAPTDVRSVLSEVVSEAEQVAPSNGHRFVVDVPSEPLAAQADADKLRQVLVHLVDNAVKFSPAGGTVVVAARRRDDTVEFEVSDEGIGIPPSERDRIFRKFYRADPAALGDAAGGTGLGLFIVHGLVSAMGGRIRVESSEGNGSSFQFELPAAQAASSAREVADGRV